MKIIFVLVFVVFVAAILHICERFGCPKTSYDLIREKQNEISERQSIIAFKLSQEHESMIKSQSEINHKLDIILNIATNTCRDVERR